MGLIRLNKFMQNDNFSEENDSVNNKGDNNKDDNKGDNLDPSYDGNRYSFEKSSIFDEFDIDYEKFRKNNYTESDEELINKYVNYELSKRKVRIFPIILALALICFIGAISVFAIGYVGGILNNDSSLEKIVITGNKNEDESRKFQITATSEWQKNDTITNEDASLKISSKHEDKGFLIICEDKKEIGETVALEDYYKAVKEKNMEKNASIDDGLKAITTKEGYKAEQFKANMEQSGKKFKYLITALETEENFYQIIAWTTESKYIKSEKEFMSMTDSFKELE
ncbi:MAG: hypothetical protein Q8942_17510 [Bacillota bacterium]|nr:hypothetical protein [Bacillota bacterium]